MVWSKFKQRYPKVNSWLQGMPFVRGSFTLLEALSLGALTVVALLVTNTGVLSGYAPSGLILLGLGVLCFVVGAESGKNRRVKVGKTSYTALEYASAAVGLYVIAVNAGYLAEYLFASVQPFITGFTGAGIIIASYVILALQD